VSTINTGSLLVAGVIMVIVGIAIIAVPFYDWTEKAVADKLPDIFGVIIFVIGIIFVCVWAFKRLTGKP
jgi:phosphoglycerol transferase MdoB-like AlkP superfamily enzyme